MSEGQVIGAIKNFVGKVQEDFGKLIGSKDQLNKGVRKQIVGDAQQNYGKAVEAVKNARRH
ncbi:MAG: CsbD family protein [Methylotenera sp.]